MTTLMRAKQRMPTTTTTTTAATTTNSVLMMTTTRRTRAGRICAHLGGKRERRRLGCAGEECAVHRNGLGPQRRRRGEGSSRLEGRSGTHARCRAVPSSVSSVGETGRGVDKGSLPGIRGDASELVGSTPLIALSREFLLRHGVPGGEPCIALKLELMEPCCSVKDRIGLEMVRAAEEQGHIAPGRTTLVEPTSGNTGVGLAFIAAARGYKLVVTMPEDSSIERRILLRAFGAEVILTPASSSMSGAIARAHEMVEADPEHFYMPQQFKNPSNVEAHYRTTGPEIWRDTGGRIDHLVAGIGTGGTITGCGRYIKEMDDGVNVVGVEPAESSVLQGGSAGFHQIQGIGAGFVPEVLERDVVDELVGVSSYDAIMMARRLAVEEGLLVGISSGAAVAAALQVARRSADEVRRQSGGLIVCIAPSFGERYLSTLLYQNAWEADQKELEKLPSAWRGSVPVPYHERR